VNGLRSGLGLGVIFLYIFGAWRLEGKRINKLRDSELFWRITSLYKASDAAGILTSIGLHLKAKDQGYE
jgi:hypothetical protein